MNNYHLPTQTTLLLGSHDQTAHYSQRILQERLCSQKNKTEEEASECFCRPCRQIKNQQHHDIIFVSPEDNYTLDDISIIFDRTRFATQEPQYYLLFNIQRLTQATANKLLKLLEEPPAHHYFILHADNEQIILPTIKSRCAIIKMHGYEDDCSIKNHPLLKYFLDNNYNPFNFEQTLKELHPSDKESIDLGYELLSHMKKELVIALQKKEKRQAALINTIHFLIDQLKQPPQPGSSELFWKNMYLSFPRKQ